MPWAALDDQFHSNPKVVSVGLAGAGLYARSISYCAAYLTDGFIPATWARQVASRTIIDKLVAKGLWKRVENGYELPDYLTFNPSKAEVKKKREVAAERKRRSRQNKPETENVTQYVTPDVTRDEEAGHGGSHAGPRARVRPRARAVADPSHPITPRAEDFSLTADRTTTTSNGLPFEKQLATTAIMAWVGADQDNGTRTIIDAYAEKLPEGSLRKIVESIRTARPRDRAKYVVGAMKSELEATA